MADGISTKLELNGEKEYKQALDNAYRSLRVLRSELKAETAELGRNATAQDKAKTKISSLQKQIAEQEKIVKTLEQALKDSKNEYKDNQEVQDKWAEKLNKAREALANLKNQLGDAESALQNFGNDMKDVSSSSGEAMETVVSFNDCLRSIGNIASGIGDSISGIFESSVDTMKAMVDEMFSLMGQAWSAAGNWKQIQTMWGGDLKSIEKVFTGMALQGIDSGEITSGIQKLVTNTHNGNKETLAALDALHIEEKNYSSHWDYFVDVMEALENQKDSKTRDELVRAIFGDKKGSGMMDVLDNWDDGMSRYQKDYEETNIALGSDEIEALDNVSHKITEIQQLWNGIKTNIGAKLSTILNMDKLSDDTLEILRNLGELMSSTGTDDTEEGKERKREIIITLSENIETLINDICSSMQNLSKFLDELGGELEQSDNPVVQFIGKLIGSLSDILDWLGTHGNTIIAWLDRMLPVIGANKVSEMVTGKGIGDWLTDVVKLGIDVTLLGKLFGSSAGTAIGATAATFGGGIGAAILQAVPALANLGGVGVMGGTWLADHTEFGRTLRDGGSLSDAFAASGKAIETWWNGIWSDENKQNFLDNWNPKGENPNIIAQGVGELYDAWVKNGENTANFWGGLLEDVSNGLSEAGTNLQATEGYVYSDEYNIEDILADLARRDEAREETEDVDLDKEFSAAEKLEAIQDWWDAYRNADQGLEGYDEEQRAYEYLEEVLGDQFGDVMDSIIHKLDEVEDQNSLEDLPSGWFADISGALKNLNNADEYKGDRESRLPALIEAACERGTAKKEVHVTVTLDGQTLMDYVDTGLASSYHFRG